MIYELKISARGKTPGLALFHARKVIRMMMANPVTIAENVDKTGNALAEMKAIKPTIPENRS